MNETPITVLVAALPALARAIGDALAPHAMKVRPLASPAGPEESADAAVIDADFPGLDLALAEGWAGVILLLAEPARVGELSGQASAVLAKPVRPAKLAETLKGLVARAQATQPREIGPFRLDPLTRTLSGPGGQFRLTDKEMEILDYLAAQRRTVAREELLSAVWNYGEGVTTHTVETHIYRLRQKIEPDPRHATLLLTLPGGYRLA
jgi:DNA-binding response OmpR family regulator